MVALAFLASGYLLSREMDRKGLPGEIGSSIVFWAIIGGLVGARLWVIVEDFPGFLARPVETLFSGAGFAFYGGFVGGVAAVYGVIRHHRLPFWRVADCTAPVLALGHAIGRIGCQLAGDGDWGTVSDVPWAMAYPNAIVGWDYPPGVRVHPTPIYETLAYGLIFSVLWNLRKRERPDGALFALYLVLAPMARFVIEFVRHNPRHAMGLSIAQIFSLLLVATGVWLFRRECLVAAPGPSADRSDRQ